MLFFTFRGELMVVASYPSRTLKGRIPSLAHSLVSRTPGTNPLLYLPLLFMPRSTPVCDSCRWWQPAAARIWWWWRNPWVQIPAKNFCFDSDIFIFLISNDFFKLFRCYFVLFFSCWDFQGFFEFQGQSRRRQEWRVFEWRWIHRW